MSCWGGNGSGQLGNGTATNSSVPVAVTGITNATAITADYDQSCALLDTGAVSCWGLNIFGGLGIATNTSSSVPVAVIGITNATTIDAGRYHLCALLDTGAMSCRGNNEVGQLGDGGGFSYVPTPVVGLP